MASTPPDSRTNPYRSDLAAGYLRGAVMAERYADPQLRQCIRGVVPLLSKPAADAPQVSQIRYGEFLDVFEERGDGFAWVQNRSDRYVGYMPRDGTMNDAISDLSFRICTMRTFVYPAPDLKTPPIDELTLGAYIQTRKRAGDFVELMNGGFVFAGHIGRSADALTPDYVFTAGQLLGVPYLWGGRTPKGIDCSGLVQLVLEMAGVEAPRDSDQQREAIGQPLERYWRDMAWKRGDIVFFPGHVGIMTGGDHLIHATAHVMAVTVEPLIDVVTRGDEILAKGRPEVDRGGY